MLETRGSQSGAESHNGPVKVNGLKGIFSGFFQAQGKSEITEDRAGHPLSSSVAVRGAGVLGVTLKSPFSDVCVSVGSSEDSFSETNYNNSSSSRDTPGGARGTGFLGAVGLHLWLWSLSWELRSE